MACCGWWGNGRPRQLGHVWRVLGGLHTGPGWALEPSPGVGGNESRAHPISVGEALLPVSVIAAEGRETPAFVDADCVDLGRDGETPAQRPVGPLLSLRNFLIEGALFGVSDSGYQAWYHSCAFHRLRGCLTGNRETARMHDITLLGRCLLRQERRRGHQEPLAAGSPGFRWGTPAANRQRETPVGIASR